MLSLLVGSSKNTTSLAVANGVQVQPVDCRPARRLVVTLELESL